MDTRTLDYEKIAVFIAERRREKGMTQKQLAELLGVTDRAVSKWERGKSFPDVSLLLPLCEALSISTSELFAGEIDSLQRKPSLTHEEAGELVVRGVGSYLKKARAKSLAGWAVTGSLLILLILLGFFNWQGKQPTDFAGGDFTIGTIRTQQRDGKIVTLNQLDEITEKRIKGLLQDLERGEALGEKEHLKKSQFVEIEGLGTFYCDGYVDEKNKTSYYYLQSYFYDLSRMIDNYVKELDYTYQGEHYFDFGDRAVQLSAEINQIPQEKILEHYCKVITEKDIEEGVYTEFVDVLSIEELSDEEVFQSYWAEAIQKELDYYNLYDYRIYRVVSDWKYTEKKNARLPQIPEGEREQIFLIGDYADGYEIVFQSFPSAP
ncbi:helix-turn-helix transcriptional regulator [Anaerovoracaceae bacterium 42-11]